MAPFLCFDGLTLPSPPPPWCFLFGPGGPAYECVKERVGLIEFPKQLSCSLCWAVRHRPPAVLETKFIDSTLSLRCV